MTDRAERLRPEDIVNAYRLFLGRAPSEREVERKIGKIHDMKALRRTFIGSQEFLRVFRELGRREITSQSTLIHLHIPKTAGSSLNVVLARSYAAEEIIRVSHETLGNLRDMDEAARRQLKVVMGHMLYGADSLLPQPSVYLCLLRPPGPRILSFYRFVLRSRKHPLHEECYRLNMSFGDFLCYSERIPSLRGELDNGQIRRLAGRFGSTGSGHEAEMFDRALVNIFASNMIFGLTERFGDFLFRLKREGLISDSTPALANVSLETTDIEEEKRRLTDVELDLFEKYVAWDQKFYDLCSRVYLHPSNERRRHP